MTRWPAALLLLGACAEAQPEDLTARYLREAPSAPIVIQAAANGDARVEAGSSVFIRKDGTAYVVLKDAGGSYTARIEDMLAISSEHGRDALLPGARVQPEYTLSKGGDETVAGRRGTLWKAHPAQVPSLTSAEVVVSEDPALAPLGRALAMQSSFSIRRNGTGGNFEAAMLDLFDKGTVLRFNQFLKLERIDKVPIPTARFDLPRPVLDKGQLAERLRRSPPSAP